MCATYTRERKRLIPQKAKRFWKESSRDGIKHNTSLLQPVHHTRRRGNTPGRRARDAKHFPKIHSPLLTTPRTMEGYALSEDALFSSCLLNFPGENTHDQVIETFFIGIPRTSLSGELVCVRSFPCHAVRNFRKCNTWCD